MPRPVPITPRNLTKSEFFIRSIISLSKINVCANTLFKPASPSDATNFSPAFFTSSKVVDKFLALAASVPPKVLPKPCFNKSNTYVVPLILFK